MDYTQRKTWHSAIKVERQNSWLGRDFNFLFKPIKSGQILLTLSVWQWWSLSHSVVNLVLCTHFCREHIKPKCVWGRHAANAERCILSFHCLDHRHTHITVMKPERVVLLASCPQRAEVKEILQYIIRQARRGRLHINSACSLISGSQSWALWVCSGRSSVWSQSSWRASDALFLPLRCASASK